MFFHGFNMFFRFPAEIRLNLKNQVLDTKRANSVPPAPCLKLQSAYPDHMMQNLVIVLFKNNNSTKDQKEGVLWGRKKRRTNVLCWQGLVLLDWFGRSGHVQSQSFGIISHALGPKLNSWGNFIMVLHGFASRSLKPRFWDQETPK